MLSAFTCYANNQPTVSNKRENKNLIIVQQKIAINVISYWLAQNVNPFYKIFKLLLHYQQHFSIIVIIFIVIRA